MLAGPQKFLVLLLSFLCIVPSISNAQRYAVNQCIDQIENGNEAAARQRAEQLLTFNAISDDYIRLAEECINHVFGDQFVYYPPIGFSTIEQIDIYNSQQDVSESQDALTEFFTNLNRFYEARNQSLIFQSSQDACNNLARANPNEAFTNETCISIFRRIGHPDLEGFEDFSADNSQRAFDQLNSIDRNLLEGLSQEQISQLCKGSFAALCVLSRIAE
jgi:hypothetical protein